MYHIHFAKIKKNINIYIISFQNNVLFTYKIINLYINKMKLSKLKKKIECKLQLLKVEIIIINH